MKVISRQTLVKLLVGLLGVVLIGFLIYQDATVRATVVRIAGKLGKLAVPYLRSALQDESAAVRGQAHNALRELGADAVLSLLESLADPSPHIRAQAAYALTIIGRKAKDA